VRAPGVNFSVPELLLKFHESPVIFFKQFGTMILQGLVAWLLIAPLITAITYSVLAGPLKRLAALKEAIARPANPE
jgi:hypothetical protein